MSSNEPRSDSAAPLEGSDPTTREEQNDNLTLSPDTASDSPDAVSEEIAVPQQAEPDVVASAEGPDSNGTGSTEVSPESEQPRRRVQLRPSVGVDEFKPVPTRGSSTLATDSAVAPAVKVTSDTAPAAPVEPAEGTGPAAEQLVDEPAELSAPDAATADEQADFMKPADSGPVELPPQIDDLGDELEAEITAALAGEEQIVDAASVEEAPEQADSPEQSSEEELEEGARLKGKVDSIHGDSVFLDLGYRSPGVVPVRQFESTKLPEVGQELEVFVSKVKSDEGLIYANLPGGKQRVTADWDSVWKGQVVDCMVTKTNKGGLEIKVGGLRGFLPASQLDLKFVEDLEPFVGQKLTVKVIEANRQKRNLVVSRRACLESERQEAEEALWFTIEKGKKFAGTVKTIKDYGAFVDLGGVDGFLHIGEISWTRIKHPSEVLHEGDQIDVVVVSLDHEKKKIGLGLKQLVQDPWTNAEEKFAKGNTVSGTVTRTTNFGAFIELESGVEGLVHISELDYKRVNRVTDVLNVGQEIDVQILEVDLERKRIGLSVKALKPKPEKEQSGEKRPAEADSDVPTIVRTRTSLKGGIGDSQKGGLFGNPKDFS